MQWQAVYRDSKGAEIRIPLVEDGTGKMFVETESGSLSPYTVTLQDKTLGLLTHFRTERVTEQPPMPDDPAREEKIRELKPKLAKFPTLDLNPLLNQNPKLRAAIDQDFAGASLEQLAAWISLIDATIENLAAARKAAIPEPIFQREELRRHFRGTRVGCLFVGDLANPGSPENNWDAEWVAECEGCHNKGNVKASTILKMQIKYLEPHRCGQPCR